MPLKMNKRILRLLKDAQDALEAATQTGPKGQSCAWSDETKKETKPYLDTWVLHRLRQGIRYIEGEEDIGSHY